MKDIYEGVEFEIISFRTEDVITDSGCEYEVPDDDDI